ncbi:MAG: Tol-Pal system beta propeller repeat protein TolB [Thiothrix sp.]|nr:Tol-Pal system beta propeller repeat protein TolB [Thiothrix sp.]HPE58776.1 Tol-Pal system beta propeller repeat protein TolB [Thiolinea sp.]
MHKKSFATTILLLFSLLLSLTVRAELVIRITDGVKDGVPVIIAPFEGGDLASIVEADLARSGRFTLIDSLRAGPLQMGQVIPREILRDTGAEYIVTGREAGGLEFEIITVATGQRAASFRIPPHPSPRRMAHKAADLIFERLTGIKGAFDTRIAYIASFGPPQGQTYQLVVADADGFNPRTVLSSGKPIMSPSWSPDGRQLAYVSFETGQSAIYIQDLVSGSKRVLTQEPGMNGAPAWSPDGSRIALSLSEGGNADIYVINTSGTGLRQITNSRAIETEPAWANANTIVYTSDQGGSPQLYRTSVAGGNGNRMTFSGRYNSAPSIVGNTVAMVSGDGNRFHIALMNASSRQVNAISRGGVDESPVLAPNGAMVLYATRTGGREILVVASANGKARQTLTAPVGDVRDPAWSPYLN